MVSRHPIHAGVVVAPLKDGLLSPYFYRAGFYYEKESMYYLNNGQLVHDLKNEMEQILKIKSPKGVF